MTRRGRAVVLVLAGLLGALAWGCAGDDERLVGEPVAAHPATADVGSAEVVAADGHDVDAARAAHDARMAWWREARFGLFIHWGLYAIPGGQWGERDTHAEWIRTTAQIPLEEYAELAPRFDPVDFDADAWVRAARDAGMRYLVITTKHHDGFALFQSEVSDWDVDATPFRRDIMADIATACRRHGLRIGWYHSIMDWQHPDYLPRRGWETERGSEGADFERYVEFLHAQVTELLTRYGPIDVMWFDGEWEASWTHEHGLQLFALCRALQPDVLVNNRVDKGRAGMAGLTVGEQYVGDFGTPEQEIPDTGLPGVDWETCMTMNRYWGWNRADEQWKSTTDLVQKLCDIASKGGNFLLNVGPTETGAFPPRAVERLAALGDWMDVHGEAIHGTQASPFGQLPWGRCTTRATDGGTRLYLHVFDWPADGQLFLPDLGSPVHRAWRLAAPYANLEVDATDDGVWLRGLPAEADDAHASVIAVDLWGDAIVFHPPTLEAASDVFVDELPVTIRPADGLGVAFTFDGREPTLAEAIGKPSAFFGDPGLQLFETTTVKARSVFRDRLVGPVVERTFTQVAPRAAGEVGELEPGLFQAWWRQDVDTLPSQLVPGSWDGTQLVPTPVLEPDPRAEHIVRIYAGLLHVPTTGVWRFALSSDDGSRLWVGNEEVIDNDGLHGPEERRGHVALEAGWHHVELGWFNKTGGAQLSLHWAPPGGEFEPVPAEAFAHEISVAGVETRRRETPLATWPKGQGRDER